MKELSIKEKAERYDGAIDRANSLLSSNQLGNAWIYKLLPELKESKESEDDKLKEQVVYAINQLHVCECTKNKLIAWLEKLGEQKHNDNEPKFHEDEWITNGDYTWKIVEVKPLDYILQSQDGNIVYDTISHVDEQFHSFTIQDAKNGDVLTWDNGRYIILFKEIKDNIVAYCSYNTHSKHFSFYGYDAHFDCILNFTPATKEQHDLLFQKMKEADYKLDAEKKELRKISQKPTEWSEEDERNASYICAALDCYYRLREERNNTNEQEDLNKARNWLYNKLKSLRPQNNITDEELDQAKKNAYNDAINKIEYHSDEPTFDDGWSAAIWYLKKKNAYPKNTWKPTNKQMLAINTAINVLGKGTINGKYLIELQEQLMKLKE